MEENYKNNLSGSNMNSTSQNTGAKPSAPTFSSTQSQNSTSSNSAGYSSSGYIRPEDIVRGNPEQGKQSSSPVFAYSKSQTVNPYLPSGYKPTTTLEMPEAPASNTPTQSSPAFSKGEQASSQQEQSFGNPAQTSTQTQGGDLSFGSGAGEEIGSKPVSNNFEVVGDKAPTAVRTKNVNLKKLNASRRTESRFCGHFAWFFSIANIFVCLFYILVNILYAQITVEGAEQSEFVPILKSIIEAAPYATLVVCALTLIALINSIVQLTIRVNKYSKLTITIVFILSIAAFVYLYLVGYLAQTIELLTLVAS